MMCTFERKARKTLQRCIIILNYLNMGVRKVIRIEEEKNTNDGIIFLQYWVLQVNIFLFCFYFYYQGQSVLLLHCNAVHRTDMQRGLEPKGQPNIILQWARCCAIIGWQKKTHTHTPMLADYMYTYNCGLFKITLSVMATHNAGGSMANQICVHPRTHEKKKENLQQKRGTIL